VTPIKDRTSRKNSGGVTEFCKASYSTVTVEVLESAYARETGKLLNFSSQQIRDCSSDEDMMEPTGEPINHGCEGGTLFSAFTYAS